MRFILFGQTVGCAGAAVGNVLGNCANNNRLGIEDAINIGTSSVFFQISLIISLVNNLMLFIGLFEVERAASNSTINVTAFVELFFVN